MKFLKKCLFVSMIVLATPFFAIGLMLLFIAALITDTACSLVEGWVYEYTRAITQVTNTIRLLVG